MKIIKIEKNGLITWKMFPETPIEREFIQEFIDADVSFVSGWNENNINYFIEIKSGG